MSDITTVEALEAALATGSLSGARVRNLTLEDLSFEGVALTAVAFLGCVFRRTSLSQSSLVGGAFQRC